MGQKQFLEIISIIVIIYNRIFHLSKVCSSLTTLPENGDSMNILSRSQVYDVINKNEGKIFSCVFTKKDGEIREMKCRTGVKKYLKGGELRYDPIEKGLLPVYEIKNESDEDKASSYRMVNVQTLIRLKIGGLEYRVMDVIDGGLSNNQVLNQENETQQSTGKAA
jgi:hypothetical protein